MLFPRHLLGRKGKFYNIWTAATRKIKYVKTSEIKSLNISGTCEDILMMIENETRTNRKQLSLDISSKLVHGLILIYREQVKFLIKDIHSFLMIVRKPLLQDSESQSTQESCTPKTGPKRPKKVKITPEEGVVIATDKGPEPAIPVQNIDEITLREIPDIPRPKEPAMDMGINGDQLLEEILGQEIEQAIPANGKRAAEYNEPVAKFRKSHLEKDISETRIEIEKISEQENLAPAEVQDIEKELMLPPKTRVKSAKKTKNSQSEKYNLHVLQKKWVYINNPNCNETYHDNPILQLLNDARSYKPFQQPDDLGNFVKVETSNGESLEDDLSYRKSIETLISPMSVSVRQSDLDSTPSLTRVKRLKSIEGGPQEQELPMIQEIDQEQVELVPPVSMPELQESAIFETVTEQQISEELEIGESNPSEDEWCQRTLKKIYEVKDKEKITLESITTPPYTKKKIARSFMGILVLIKRGYLKPFTKPDGITFSHVRVVKLW